MLQDKTNINIWFYQCLFNMQYTLIINKDI